MHGLAPERRRFLRPAPTDRTPQLRSGAQPATTREGYLAPNTGVDTRGQSSRHTPRRRQRTTPLFLGPYSRELAVAPGRQTPGVDRCVWPKTRAVVPVLSSEIRVRSSDTPGCDHQALRHRRTCRLERTVGPTPQRSPAQLFPG